MTKAYNTHSNTILNLAKQNNLTLTFLFLSIRYFLLLYMETDLKCNNQEMSHVHNYVHYQHKIHKKTCECCIGWGSISS